MGETISDMHIGLEQKDYKIQFLNNKIGIPHSKNVKGMKRLDLSKISSQDKCDRIMSRLNKTYKIHKNIEKLKY